MRMLTAFVEIIDNRFQPRHDSLTAHLQRRREVSVLDRERLRQDGETPDAFGARMTCVNSIDSRLQLLADCLFQQRIALFHLSGRGERSHRRAVQGDKRGQIRPLIAADDGVLDKRQRCQVHFEVGRRDIFAAGGDDEILLAPGDVQEAIGVEMAGVAGVKPAAGESASSRLRIFGVTRENYWPFDEDLAVGVDLYVNARRRASTDPILVAPGKFAVPDAQVSDIPHISRMGRSSPVKNRSTSSGIGAAPQAT